MNKTDFTKSLVELVSVFGLPLRAMEFNPFKEIVKPFEKAFEKTVNIKNVKNDLKLAADKIRKIISETLKYKLFSLKFDCATRYGRSVLGVNAQYATNGELKIVTLGMIELVSRKSKYDISYIYLIIIFCTDIIYLISSLMFI